MIDMLIRVGVKGRLGSRDDEDAMMDMVIRVDDVIRLRGRHLRYTSLHRPPSWFICIRIRAQTTNQRASQGQI